MNRSLVTEAVRKMRMVHNPVKIPEPKGLIVKVRYISAILSLGTWVTQAQAPLSYEG